MMADARDLLRRALAIDPRGAGSHYNLTVVADESGDASTAIEITSRSSAWARWRTPIWPRKSARG